MAMVCRRHLPPEHARPVEIFNCAVNFILMVSVIMSGRNSVFH